MTFFSPNLSIFPTPKFSHVWYVTRFKKTHLPRTQQQDTFHHQAIVVHINQQFQQVLMLKVSQAAFAVACQTSTSALGSLK